MRAEDELLESATRVWSRAVKTLAHVNYDSIGVGAGCGAKFKELNEVRTQAAASGEVSYSKFIAGAAVQNPDEFYGDPTDRLTNKEFFYNLKAQAWWQVADLFRKYL